MYHKRKHSSQSRQFPLDITLRTLWFRNYPLITLCSRFRQLVLQFPVMFLWSRMFRYFIFLVTRFHVLHFQSTPRRYSYREVAMSVRPSVCLSVGLLRTDFTISPDCLPILFSFFSIFHFLVMVLCVRLSWLRPMSVFERTLKWHLVSYVDCASVTSRNDRTLGIVALAWPWHLWLC